MSYVRKGCFKCGNVGHFASACTEPERLCYNCKQSGHESNLCPQPRTTDSKQCYSCGGVGHIQADCPSIRVARRTRCYACGMPGHIARNCRNQARFNSGNGDHSGASIMSDTNGTTEGGSPNGGSLDSAVIRAPDAVSYPPHPTFPSGRGGGRGGYMGRMHPGGGRHFNNHMNGAGSGPGARITCYKCGEANHIARDCRAMSVKCYNCNGFGHLSRDCPESPKPQVCFKCQQEGHISRECTQD